MNSITGNSAFQATTTSLLDDILLKVDQPDEFPGFVTQNFLELVAASTAVMVECIQLKDHCSHRVIATVPSSKTSPAEHSALHKLIDLLHTQSDIQIWNPEVAGAHTPLLNKLGVGLTIAVPLVAGSWRAGGVLLFDVPDFEQIKHVLPVVKTISPVIALALRSALLSESQGAILDTRSKLLQHHRTSLREFFDNKLVGMVQVDFEGNYIQVNQHWEDMTGYSRTELSEKTFKDLAHPEELEKQLLLDKLIENQDKQTYQIEKRYIRKDGSVFWGNLSATGLYDDEDQLVGMVGMISDITKEKQAKKAQEESEQKYRTLLDNQKNAVFLHKLQAEGFTCFSEVNAYAIEHYGYSREEFLNLSPADITVQADVKKHGAVEARKKLTDLGHLEFETTHSKKSGEQFPAEISTTIISLQGEKYILSTVKDISERKHIELEKQLSQDRIMMVLNSVDADIYVADMETYEVLFMNKHMIQNFSHDFTGRTCWEVFRKDGGPCSVCTNNLLVDQTGNPTGVQIWHSQNPVNGNYYVNHDRAIQWTDGRIVRLQIATDITELKSMEAQLQQKYKMEAVGLMAGGMAHNFNNNLAIILGNVELSQFKLPKDSEIIPLLKNAKIAILRSRDLIQNILTYSREGIQNKAPIKLPPVIDETLKLLHSTIPATIDLQQTINDNSRDITINADSSRIQEALINLCNNAVHAMNEHGKLRVQLETVELQSQDIPAQYECKPGRYTRLSVQDDGSGMTPEIVDKIFDPFFTTKDIDEGTGMGLSTVQGIVNQHEGLIKVSSALGSGTTFELYFPVIKTREAEATPILRELPRGTEKILFVDDEEMLANVWGQMLKEYGYQISLMTSSTEALKMFTANPDFFDLVITDQTMPDLSGKNLIKEILRIRPEIPTILCTGYSTRINAAETKKLGIKAFCIKPLDLPELVQTVRRVLDNSDVNR